MNPASQLQRLVEPNLNPLTNPIPYENKSQIPAITSQRDLRRLAALSSKSQ